MYQRAGKAREESSSSSNVEMDDCPCPYRKITLFPTNNFARLPDRFLKFSQAGKVFRCLERELYSGIGKGRTHKSPQHKDHVKKPPEIPRMGMGSPELISWLFLVFFPTLFSQIHKNLLPWTWTDH